MELFALKNGQKQVFGGGWGGSKGKKYKRSNFCNSKIIPKLAIWNYLHLKIFKKRVFDGGTNSTPISLGIMTLNKQRWIICTYKLFKNGVFDGGGGGGRVKKFHKPKLAIWS